MKITQESRRVLENLYSTLINEDNAKDVYCLTLKINMKEYAEEINISKPNLNLCLCYLNDIGQIMCDKTYNESDDAIKEITITPLGIHIVENN